jgi:hypothetical protein
VLHLQMGLEVDERAEAEANAVYWEGMDLFKQVRLTLNKAHPLGSFQAVATAGGGSTCAHTYTLCTHTHTHTTVPQEQPVAARTLHSRATAQLALEGRLGAAEGPKSEGATGKVLPLIAYARGGGAG